MSFPHPVKGKYTPDPPDSNDLTRSDLFNTSHIVSRPVNPVLQGNARAYVARLLQTPLEALITSPPVVTSRPLTTPSSLTASRSPYASQSPARLLTGNDQFTGFMPQDWIGESFQPRIPHSQYNGEGLPTYNSMAVSPPMPLCLSERPDAFTPSHDRNTSQQILPHYKVIDSHIYMWCPARLQYTHCSTLCYHCGLSIPRNPPSPHQHPAIVQQAPKHFENFPTELAIPFSLDLTLQPRARTDLHTIRDNVYTYHPGADMTVCRSNNSELASRSSTNHLPGLDSSSLSPPLNINEQSAYPPFHYNGPNAGFHQPMATSLRTPSEYSQSPYLFGTSQTHPDALMFSPLLPPMLPYPGFVHQRPNPRPRPLGLAPISANVLSAPRHPPTGRFIRFKKLPAEIRLMIWEFSVEAPRIAYWGKDRPPAVAQVNVEARSVFLKYHPAERYRTDKLERKGMYINYSTDILYIKEDKYIPGIHELTHIPFRVTLPDMPIGPLSGYLSHGVKERLKGADPWLKNVTRLALPVHLAFMHFRFGAHSKADARWKKLNDMCPNLKELILIVGIRELRPRHTLKDLIFISDASLGEFRDKEWVGKMHQGYIRSLQSGNITTNFQLKYARLRRNRV